MAGFIQRRKLDLLLAIFSNLQYGSLTVTLPDGSTRLFDGAQPGPSADVHFTHVLVDVLLLIAPFGLYANLGWFSIPMTGLFTQAKEELAALWQQFQEGF